jgi:ABC-type sugar transport system substrate-binding protein
MAGLFDFAVTGAKELAKALNKAAEIPLDAQEKMVDAMADVVAEAQVYTAATMLQGPYYQGDVASAVKKNKLRRTKSGPYKNIVFKGMSHGNRVAEIAFVNEYGKKSQPARPFIKTANTISDKPSLEAGFSAYDKWLTSKGV